MAKKAAKKTSRTQKSTVQSEKRIVSTGRELQTALQQHTTGIFHPHWWQDRLLRHSMSDESLRLQLLRFLDVLPALRTHEAIAEHLELYYQEIRQYLPAAIRIGLDLTTGNAVLSRALAYNVRLNARRFADRFSAGDSFAEILQSCRKRRRHRLGSVLSLPGGAILSKAESGLYLQTALNLITCLSQAAAEWPEDELIDRDYHGLSAPVQLLVRSGAICTPFSTVDGDGTIRRLSEQLRTLLRTSEQCGIGIWLSAESFEQRRLTMTAFRQVLSEEEFRYCEHCGFEIDASLQLAAEEVRVLRELAQSRGIPIPVRLIGSRRPDHEIRRADGISCPDQALRSAQQIADAQEQLLESLFEDHSCFRIAVVGTTLRSVAHAIAAAEQAQLPQTAFEFHLNPVWSGQLPEILISRGHRVRIHAHTGAPVNELSLVARRLLENPTLTAQVSQNFLDSACDEELIMKSSTDNTAENPETDGIVTCFQNEPRTDFSLAENRTAMQEALDWVTDQAGGSFPLIIDGKSSDSRATLLSRSPSARSVIIGKVASASLEQAAEAVNAARRAFQSWAATDALTRVEYLELIAAEIRDRRFELAAWIISETGRTWREADAEVSDAIDLCQYYCTTMRNLTANQAQEIAGEELQVSWRPRGVCVAICNSFSPLSTMTGTLAAALAVGNTLVLKPSEQGAVTAAKLVEITRNSGLPGGVVNFLPGNKDELISALVSNPQTDVILFSGSHEQALAVNELAARADGGLTGLKRVIADITTSNPIVIDDDADLDVAIPAVIHSAFNSAGQHPAACSHVVVLKGIQQEFISRLEAAVADLQPGLASDPATQLGPVIDEETVAELKKTIKRLDPELDGNLLVTTNVPKTLKDGSFFAPHVFTDVHPDSVLVRQPSPGPLLAIVTARTIDDAFQIVGNRRGAVAAGVFSRNPETLARAQSEILAGSLFLNRDLTASVVARHPAGVCRMAGTGASTGTPEWLQQFAIPVAISEDVSRRGYVRRAPGKKR